MNEEPKSLGADTSAAQSQTSADQLPAWAKQLADRFENHAKANLERYQELKSLIPAKSSQASNQSQGSQESQKIDLADVEAFVTLRDIEGRLAPEQREKLGELKQTYGVRASVAFAQALLKESPGASQDRQPATVAPRGFAATPSFPANQQLPNRPRTQREYASLKSEDRKALGADPTFDPQKLPAQ